MEDQAIQHEAGQDTPSGFFKLPPELRLIIYSHILPRPTYFDINRPIPHEYRSMHALCVSRQFHDELANYFYSSQTLVLSVYHTYKGKHGLQEALKIATHLLASMNPRTRSHFRNLEVKLYSHNDTIARSGKIYYAPSLSPKPLSAIHPAFFASLPNLKVVLVSFAAGWPQSLPEGRRNMLEVIKWLIDTMPSVEMYWDFRIPEADLDVPPAFDWDTQMKRWIMQSISAFVADEMDGRGGMAEAKSIVQCGPMTDYREVPAYLFSQSSE